MCCGFALTQSSLKTRWDFILAIIMLGYKMFPSPSKQFTWKPHPQQALQVISASSPPSPGITALGQTTGRTILHFTLLPITAHELAIS